MSVDEWTIPDPVETAAAPVTTDVLVVGLMTARPSHDPRGIETIDITFDNGVTVRVRPPSAMFGGYLGVVEIFGCDVDADSITLDDDQLGTPIKYTLSPK